MAGSYYNDNDPDAAQWLKDLIKAGEIPDGEVDDRSILEIRSSELHGFTQCHFFAGIGGWPLALRLAGWPADRPCWTGSPPCQPFSAAGEGRGRNDERHLAPKFISLVRDCRPPVLFGEQVASAEVFGKATASAAKAQAGEPRWAWIDDLSDRLEAARYAIGADDSPSASVGAPHIRQRTFFGAYDTRLAANELADSDSFKQYRGGNVRKARRRESTNVGNVDQLADADRNGQREAGTCIAEGGDDGAFGNRPANIVADAGISRLQGYDWNGDKSNKSRRIESDQDRHNSEGGAYDQRQPRATNGFWSNADWLFCRDLKWRPVESGTFPLAYGIPRGMAKMPDGLRRLAELAGLDAGSLRRAKRFRKTSLRGYGNAINHHAAAQFILDFEAAILSQIEVP